MTIARRRRSFFVAPLIVASLTALARITTAQQASDDGPGRYVTIRDPQLVLTNVRIIDGTGAATRTNQALVISNGVIQQVGEAGTVKTPDQARIIETAVGCRDARAGLLQEYLASHLLASTTLWECT